MSTLSDSFSINEAALRLGVARGTVRRWSREGRIESIRTPGGHRRFTAAQIQRVKQHLDAAVPPLSVTVRATIAYARVSSHDQKSDLERQVRHLEDFCAARGWSYETIQDIGSGLNYNKRGLRTLIKRICAGDIERLILTHKDRLLRFGSELVFALCEQFAVEVVIINQNVESSFEEDLTQDVLEIITVFSARLYGSRSHKNRQAIEALREAANGL